MTMVLHDQAWQKMTIDEWNETTAPKVKGTWNLHNGTQSQNLDFFILFSSLSGIVGQHGQAGYASANTFLDAFVKFRTSKGLPCTSVNIGAVEGSGYLVEQNGLLNKVKGTGWRAVQESELLEVLGTAMLSATTRLRNSAGLDGGGRNAGLVEADVWARYQCARNAEHGNARKARQAGC
ncbi:KR domain-containing protein [Aspergillus foveolatus]|uniref:KR domain-containing protein n=1 Tax=Aspergillus foveolatus TaxID=210207 RepID=UPI003CCD7878